MKIQIITYSIFFMAISLAIQSQSVYESDVSMSLGIKNALSIEIENADRKTAENVWKDFIKEYGKTKKNNRSGEWRSEQISIPFIDRINPIDVYLRLEELSGMTRAYLWVDLGHDFATSSQFEDETAGMEALLIDYYREVRKEVVKKEVEEQEKVLRNVEKDLEKLKNKNEDLHEDIEEYREKISKTELEIENNIKEQAVILTEIEKQKRNLQDVIDKLNKIGRNS